MTRRPIFYSLIFIAIVAVSFGAILIRLADDAPILAIATWRLVISALLLSPLSGHPAASPASPVSY